MYDIVKYEAGDVVKFQDKILSSIDDTNFETKHTILEVEETNNEPTYQLSRIGKHWYPSCHLIPYNKDQRLMFLELQNEQLKGKLRSKLVKKPKSRKIIRMTGKSLKK